jgi:predicted permease
MDKDGDLDTHEETVYFVLRSLKKAFLHPVTIAAAVGIVFFCLPIDQYITDTESSPVIYVINQTLNNLANLVAPLSMVVIGLRLAEINFKGFFKDVYMYAFIALRHFLLPIITILLVGGLRLLGVEINDFVYMVLVIMSATPAATSATMFAEKFDCDAAYVSKLVAFSTILSIVSMPLMVMLANLF